MMLRTRSGAVGLNAMVQIATSEKAPAAARLSAARALMEHAGLLGTAKEGVKTRSAAENKGNIIDHNAVLDRLASLKTMGAA